MENSESLLITRLEGHGDNECSSGKLNFSLDPKTDTGLLGFLSRIKLVGGDFSRYYITLRLYYAC